MSEDLVDWLRGVAILVAVIVVALGLWAAALWAVFGWWIT